MRLPISQTIPETWVPVQDLPTEANVKPPAAGSAALDLPVGPAPQGPAPVAEASPRSPPGPGGSRPGPETFRQRFRQFRYHLRELESGAGGGNGWADSDTGWEMPTVPLSSTLTFWRAVSSVTSSLPHGHREAASNISSLL